MDSEVDVFGVCFIVSFGMRGVGRWCGRWALHRDWSSPDASCWPNLDSAVFIAFRVEQWVPDPDPPFFAYDSLEPSSGF